MNEALLAQRRPCLNKGDYRLVTNQEQNRSTGREAFRWGRTGRAPRPAADGTLEQAEIILEMTSDAAVAHDAERSCVDCWYLSHGSGPLIKTAKPSTRVAVRQNRRLGNLSAKSILRNWIATFAEEPGADRAN